MKKAFDIFYWILMMACSILLCGLMIFMTEMFTDSTLFNAVIILPCVCLTPYFVKKLLFTIKNKEIKADKEERVTLIESIRRSFPMYPLMLLGVTMVMQFYGTGTVLYTSLILMVSLVLVAVLYIVRYILK